ncbi:hypothetical protein [Actinomadura gamaensis]|uniref:Uncharacterized protein n=1 Tax=Actinomadura gamaensis TaxID=1763541 RepID=A0ABV9TUC2_9ACTN
MRRFPGPVVGALIGAVFGTVFVLVNAHAPLAPAAGIALRIAAVVALGAVILLGVVVSRKTESAGAADRRPGEGMFGPRYRWVVLAEAVALFGGFPVLRQLGAPTEANVAWIAIVVGVHFLVLARVWSESTILIPGAGLTLLGITGFALAAASSENWIPAVSGVGSGLVLLAGSLGFVLREHFAGDASGLVENR